MSSLRRIIASRANGARSRGPVTAAGKQTSSMNAMRHALLARCVVLDNESPDGFQALLAQHIDRFQPADGVEFGMIEEMVAAWWRMRRALAIETRMFANRLADQNGPDELGRLAAAFENFAGSNSMALIHRYETRLHCMYQRSLQNLLLMRLSDAPGPVDPSAGELAPPDIPKEPNPISGQ